MKILKILSAILFICLAVTHVYAIKFPEANKDLTYGQSGSSEVEHVVQGTWATVAVIAQILAVAAVVFAGLRYMFASADQRSDIKKSMAVLTLGAILVFVTVPVVRFVVSALEEITGYDVSNGTGETSVVSVVSAKHNIYIDERKEILVFF